MSDRVSVVIEGLQALRASADHESRGAYWSAYCRLVRELCVADEAMVVQQRAGRLEIRGHAAGATRAPAGAAADATLPDWAPPLLARATERGFAISPDGADADPGARVAVPLAGVDSACLLLCLAPAQVPRVNELLLRARLVADMTPDAGLSHSTVGDGLLAEYLQLIARLHRHERFATAAYALVNGLVSQDPAIGLAVLGWREGAYIKARAISHHDRFERRTEWVKRLEAALEESADQDQPVAYPDADAADPATGGALISRAHQQLAVQTGAQGVFTLPIGDMGDEGEMVLLVMSYDAPINPAQQNRLRLLVELIHPLMSRLRRGDAPPWRRAGDWLRRGAGWALGSDRLVLKALSLVLSAGLLYGVFGTLPHRVEGSASLVTDETRLYAAPFEGRIEAAAFNPGEPVAAGTVLARMDIEDLLLQRGELQADLRRQAAEVRRARAVGELVDAEIASARAEQARARLARIEARLGQAVITASMDGVVVEGERQALLGRPVRQGDPLYRLARLEGIYLKIEVPEADVHFLEPGETGEFVFLSRPGVTVPLEVARIIPMARVNAGSGAVFEVVAKPLEPASDWWRPGMEGVARIDQGPRSVFWVIGHRLVNRLRVWLWW